MPYMEHLDVAGGPVFVTQAQFDGIYAPLGWTLTSPPIGPETTSPSKYFFHAGNWAPGTAYAAGAVVQTPGGGLLYALDDLTTDATYSETGFLRLVADPGTGGGGGGGGGGPILSF